MDVVIVREGKNAKGRVLALVLGTVGKGVLAKAFGNSVKAIEARDNVDACSMTTVRGRRTEPRAALDWFDRSWGWAQARSAPWRWTRRSIGATGTTVATPTSRAGSSSEGLDELGGRAGAGAGCQATARPRARARGLRRATRGCSTTPRTGGSASADGRRVRPARCAAQPKLWFGLPFGAAVWASGYVVLPLLGVYEPIWKYDLETLRKDLSAHLVFGTATAAAFRILAHRGRQVTTAKTQTQRRPAMNTTLGTAEVATDEISVANVDMKLEVVIIPVSDVDRAKAFYGSLGWRLDVDFASTTGSESSSSPRPARGLDPVRRETARRPTPGSAAGPVPDRLRRRGRARQLGAAESRSARSSTRGAGRSVPARRYERSLKGHAPDRATLRLVRLVQRP